jgi:hypothetical protein
MRLRCACLTLIVKVVVALSLLLAVVLGVLAVCDDEINPRKAA